MNVAEALRLIRDEGPPRADVTPLYANPEAFVAVVDAIVERTAALNYNAVAAIDALGFVLGGAIAAQTKRGIIAVRKQGKLPRATLSESFPRYDGGTDTLEIAKDALTANDRVLLVDEWIETGATITAAMRLIERCGARVAGVATLHCDLPLDHPLFNGTPVIALNQDA
ncbi:MAG: purine phosphoribosyltransferase family protein [Chloroflexota bacterium]